MNIQNIHPHQIAPHVHINGNAGAELADEWWQFYRSLQSTLSCFPYQSFHERNHYPKTEASQKAAHEARVVILQAIHDLLHVSGEVMAIMSEAGIEPSDNTTNQPQ